MREVLWVAERRASSAALGGGAACTPEVASDRLFHVADRSRTPVRRPDAWIADWGDSSSICSAWRSQPPLLAGLVCPLVGCFLMLRRTSFYGIALPQFAAAGVACGFVAHALVDRARRHRRPRPADGHGGLARSHELPPGLGRAVHVRRAARCSSPSGRKRRLGESRAWRRPSRWPARPRFSSRTLPPRARSTSTGCCAATSWRWEPTSSRRSAAVLGRGA